MSDINECKKCGIAPSLTVKRGYDNDGAFGIYKISCCWREVNYLNPSSAVSAWNNLNKAPANADGFKECTPLPGHIESIEAVAAERFNECSKCNEYPDSYAVGAVNQVANKCCIECSCGQKVEARSWDEAGSIWNADNPEQSAEDLSRKSAFAWARFQQLMQRRAEHSERKFKKAVAGKLESSQVDPAFYYEPKAEPALVGPGGPGGPGRVGDVVICRGVDFDSKPAPVMLGHDKSKTVEIYINEPDGPNADMLERDWTGDVVAVIREALERDDLFIKPTAEQKQFAALTRRPIELNHKLGYGFGGGYGEI